MKYSFKELIDVPKLQELTNVLYMATSIPSTILTMEGEVLTGSGWQRICTEFHRRHPQIEKECIKSDIRIRKKLDEGESFAAYKCPRGLVDASSPVIIAGKHVANVFVGQLFLEPPDETTEQFFREQAQKFGFDETEYIKAFREIPVFTEEKFRAALSFLSKLTIIIADMSLIRLHELESKEALQESEAELKSIFRAAPIGIGVVYDRTLQHVNEYLCKMIGYSKNELIGQDARILYPTDEDYEYVGREKYRQIKKYGTGTVETRFKHKDGIIIDILMSSTPLDLANLSTGVTFTALDISEKKQNDRDTQTIMESTVGKTGKELFNFIVIKLCEWLKCDCAIVGQIVEDETVKAISMVLDGEFISNYSYTLKGSPCEETTRKCYCLYPENVCALFPDDPDLIEMDAEGYVGASLEDKNGKAIGILCCISRDKLQITKHTENVMKIIAAKVSSEIESKKNVAINNKLETQLQQSQKMESIGTLAGGIAHDFNNILFPIVGHSEMLLEDIPEDSPFRDGLNQIYSGAMRASELVKQILTFSRQESGELKLMKMQPIIKEALKLIRSTIPTTIEIKQNIQADCGEIKADPTQIHQIVMNLATNAYHAMEETGGELKVSLKQMELGTRDLINPDMIPGQYACLSVVDTGIGMNKELTQKIFNPFFTTKAVGKGTGMGLSVVHGIVAGMGGAVRVYSEPGKGTQFYVYFPVEKNSFVKHSVQTHEAIQGGIERILLVDDEDAIIIMEKLMLERLGYQVTSRTSSIEALEAFRDRPDKFNLVITDMAMPNMSGDKLSAELTKIRPDIPVLLCTGFSETMSEEKAASLGIKGFLLKPIVMKDLAQKIREVLDRQKSKRLNIKAFIDKPIPMKDLAEKVKKPLNQSKALIMKKILIIDDDVAVRNILIKLLERNEYTVIAASNGDQGIQLFKDHLPDLVITDIIMPEKEGLETIGELKELNSDVKIIAISGGGVGYPEIYLDLASGFGAVRTFLKPINNNELLSTIKDLIA